jgi:hypothetical protein
MNQRTKHCRPVSRTPVVAQTSLEIKVDFYMSLLNFAGGVQRSKPWGIVFPSGGGGGTDNNQ